MSLALVFSEVMDDNEETSCGMSRDDVAGTIAGMTPTEESSARTAPLARGIWAFSSLHAAQPRHALVPSGPVPRCSACHATVKSLPRSLKVEGSRGQIA